MTDLSHVFDDDGNVHVADSIDSQEEIRCWLVADDEVQDHERLEGAMYCTECVNTYVGDGHVCAVSHEGMQANVFCADCGVFLGDE